MTRLRWAYVAQWRIELLATPLPNISPVSSVPIGLEYKVDIRQKEAGQQNSDEFEQSIADQENHPAPKPRLPQRLASSPPPKPKEGERRGRQRRYIKAAGVNTLNSDELI